MTATLLTSARLVGTGDGQCSVLVDQGLVAAVGASPPRPPGAEAIDLEGRFVMRGLWDHHVHLDQWALARRRLDLSACRSAAHVCALVRRQVDEAPPPPGQPLVGHGFRDALWADVPSRRALDEVARGLPVVLLSHDLHSGWLNTAAFGRFGLQPADDGQLREGALHALLPRLAQVPTSMLDDWAGDAVRAAAARGVTGIVDFEMTDNLAAWSRRFAGGSIGVRVTAAVYPEHAATVVSAGLCSGEPVPGSRGLLTVGPLKLFLDGSLNARTAYCQQPYPDPGDPGHPHGLLFVPPAELGRLMREANRQGFTCAVHAIGDRANTLALDGFAESSARGSVEHAQLLCPEDLPRFGALGVAASVQPGHVTGDRDVADRHWRDRTGRAFAYASLLGSGAELRFGSDAPVSPLDPWLTIAAAVRRSDDDRPPWHPEQRLSVAAALRASTGGRYILRVGDRADLVVLDADPLTARGEDLASLRVHGTLVAGHWVWRSDLQSTSTGGSVEG